MWKNFQFECVPYSLVKESVFVCNGYHKYYETWNLLFKKIINYVFDREVTQGLQIIIIRNLCAGDTFFPQYYSIFPCSILKITQLVVYMLGTRRCLPNFSNLKSCNSGRQCQSN